MFGIVKSENKIVSSTLDVYRKAMSDLLPTPAKAHYTFNLRDFSKVILGICMSDKETILVKTLLVFNEILFFFNSKQNK